MSQLGWLGERLEPLELDDEVGRQLRQDYLGGSRHFLVAGRTAESFVDELRLKVELEDVVESLVYVA